MHNARVRRYLVLSLLLLASCRERHDASAVSSRPTPAKPAAAIQAPKHVVVIGIDGASWYVIRQLARDGQVPAISRLMEHGAWGDLQTMAPTVSPAIWTTLATGYSPERHNITNFATTLPDTGAVTLIGSTERHEAAIWNLATEAKVSVGVVNWWATFPAETVDGFIVSDRANLRRRFGYQSVLQLNDTGLGKVGEGETYPAELLPKILNVIGTNSDVPPIPQKLVVDPMPAAKQAELAHHQTLVRKERLSVLKFVMLQDYAALTATHVAIENGGVPRLLLTYLSGLDAAEHQFWAYYEPNRYAKQPDPEDVKAFGHVVPAYYRYVDSMIGDLLQRVPKDSLIVLISDHGHDANMDWDPKAEIGEYGKWTMGSHGNAPPGIILFSGPGVQAGYLRRTTVYDVAPTLLALVGIPPSSDMPGRVITEAFQPEARALLRHERVDRKPQSRAPSHPKRADIDPEILEKLRSLGYIR